MASREILPKSDLKLLMGAKVGDIAETRFGPAKVTELIKKRARFAYRHFDD
jgi:hypothetical protein